MRSQRQQLKSEALKKSAVQLAATIRCTAEFQLSERIAFYQAINGEADPGELFKSAITAGKHCYLPLIRDKRLVFIRHHHDSALITNRMGIPEPVYNPESEAAASDLDLVCMPLVAYDKLGTRLGMGGGFYDQSFAF